MIIDTDASADVDDVVAICLAHKLQDRGETDILAIVHDAGLPGMHKKGMALGSAASRKGCSMAKATLYIPDEAFKRA